MPGHVRHNHVCSELFVHICVCKHRVHQTDILSWHLRITSDFVYRLAQVLNGFIYLLNVLCGAIPPSHSSTSSPGTCSPAAARGIGKAPSWYVFNTFILVQYGHNGYDGVRRWLKRIHLADVDRLLFPINLGDQHWCLGFADIKMKTLRLYDSLNVGSGATPPRKRLKPVMRFLKDALDIPTKAWVVDTHVRCWQQQNNYDCGVHVCRTAYLLCTGNASSIDIGGGAQIAYDAGKFRHRIRKALKAGTLLSSRKTPPVITGDTS